MCYQLNHISKIQTHLYKNQIEALESFYPIIKASSIPIENISFGGGTALALYYFQHRLSFDIDLFLSDNQYMNFLSPKLWVDDTANFSSNYMEQAHHIRLDTINNIKIDILSRPNPYKNILDNTKSIFNFDFYICSLEDIIANKIVFRKKENKARDIFDIAVSIEKYPKLLKELLDKELITRKDLNDLKESLSGINKEKYHQQIMIVEPFNEFKKIAENAYDFILSHIDALDIKHAIHKRK